MEVLFAEIELCFCDHLFDWLNLETVSVVFMCLTNFMQMNNLVVVMFNQTLDIAHLGGKGSKVKCLFKSFQF